jgi:hypothetical protein
VYGLPVEVESLAAHEAGFFVRKVDRRKIVEEVYPIKGTHARHIRQVHGCRGPRKRGSDTSRPQGKLRDISAGPKSKYSCTVAMRPGRDKPSELADDHVGPTIRNGRVAKSRGHWRQWLRWYASEGFTVVIVHVQVPLGSAVCKALLTKGIKVTSVR